VQVFCERFEKAPALVKAQAVAESAARAARGAVEETAAALGGNKAVPGLRAGPGKFSGVFQGGSAVLGRAMQSSVDPITSQ